MGWAGKDHVIILFLKLYILLLSQRTQGSMPQEYHNNQIDHTINKFKNITKTAKNKQENTHRETVNEQCNPNTTQSIVNVPQSSISSYSAAG